MRLRAAADLDALDFVKGDGLVACVAQHARTGELLMLGYADRQALERTLETGELHFHSRSRDALWRKGETSGNVLRVRSLHGDCDGDAVVALALPAGPVCHTGSWSCFEAPPTLAALDRLLTSRAAQRPEGSYTTRLLQDRNLRLKKLGEEATELALACVAEDGARAADEAADLLYHALVACRAAGATLDDLLAALDARLPRED